MRGAADESTNANAISFGFATRAVFVSMLVLMAIFEHLINPDLASSSSSSSSPLSESGSGEGPHRGLSPISRLCHQQYDSSPDKLGGCALCRAVSQKVEVGPVAEQRHVTPWSTERRCTHGAGALR
jgi:hypothetical protein